MSEKFSSENSEDAIGDAGENVNVNVNVTDLSTR